MCVIRCGVGVRRVGVIMIGRWSEEVCALIAMYFVLVLENRRLCLGRMCSSVTGVGCECIVLCCLGWTYC